MARVAESYLGLAAYAEIHYLSRLVDGEFTMTGANWRRTTMTADRLALYHTLKNTPAIQSVTARQDMIDNLVKTLINNQYVFIGMLVLFSGIVFFGSVVNSSLVSLAERQREVATFRAMGYGPWEVGGLVLAREPGRQLVGTLLGLAVWLLSGRADIAGLCPERPDSVAGGQCSVGLDRARSSLSLVFALCAHAVVQWRVHRMDYLEALKVQGMITLRS